MNVGVIFSGRAVFLLLMILFIVTGIMLSFWGYKYFRIILLGMVGAVICFFAYQVSERLAENPVVRLILCVAVSFFGICMAYFVDIIITFFLEKTRAKRIMVGRIYIFSALLGAILLAFTVYYGIYRSRIAAMLTAFVFGGTGLVVQYRNKDKQIRFRTYDDLVKLKPLSREGGEEAG